MPVALLLVTYSEAKNITKQTSNQLTRHCLHFKSTVAQFQESSYTNKHVLVGVFIQTLTRRPFV